MECFTCLESREMLISIGKVTPFSSNYKADEKLEKRKMIGYQKSKMGVLKWKDKTKCEYRSYK